MQKKIRVGILFGGKSAEHEVSLQSAKNVIDAIDFLCFYFTLIVTFLSTTILAAIAYNSSAEYDPVHIPDTQRFFK